MNFVTSISLVVLGAMFLALLGWGSIRAAWRNCEGRRGVFAALAILAAVCSIVAQKPSPDTPTITVDALLRDVGCYATNDVFHAAVTNAPSYAGVDFSDRDLIVYARERGLTNAASWFELTPRKKFSQQPADYAIENATNFNYMVYLNYVPPSPVHTNGVFELYGFVIPGEEQGETDQLSAGFINSRAIPPPFDAEVEYLQSTGTQYIDTGVIPTSATRVQCAFLLTSVPSDTFAVAFGAFRSQSETSGFALFLNNTVPVQARTGGLGKPNIISAFSVAKDFNYEVYLAFNTLRVNGQSYSPSQNNTWTSLSSNMYIFSGSVAYESRRRIPGRFYYFKIWQGDVLVRDYSPVRKDGVGYLYDRVSGQLFGNAGTGAFGVGPDK